MAIGSLVLVEDDIAVGHLVAPFPDLALDGPGFHVLFRKDLQRDPAMRTFLIWLSKNTDLTVG